jgi:hypothetical protein
MDQETDIVKVLRCWRTTGKVSLCFKAADEIEKLRTLLSDILDAVDDREQILELREVERRLEAARAALQGEQKL